MDRNEAAPANTDEIDFLDFVLLAAENARLLILGPLVAGLAALGIASLITPKFTAVTRILPPQQQGPAAMFASQLGSLGGLAGIAGLNVKNPAEMHVALIKSRTIADRLVDRFNLLSIYRATYRDEARASLATATKVAAGHDGLITIEVDDTDPKRAADLANAYVEELSRLTGSLAITEAQQRRLFFERQLKQAQEQLKNAEASLAEVGAGENLLKSTPQAVIEAIARLKAQVTAQEIRLSTMRGYLTEASPELQLAQRELASQRAQLAKAELNQPDKAKSGSEYLKRFRDFKYHETLFELMAKQYEVARLDEAREGAVIQVVDAAVVPERKSKPRRSVITIAATLAAGLLLALFVFARHTYRHAQSDTDFSVKLARIRGKFRWLRQNK